MKEKFNNKSDNKVIATFYSKTHHELIKRQKKNDEGARLPYYTNKADGEVYLATKVVKCRLGLIVSIFKEYEEAWPDAVLTSKDAKLNSFLKINVKKRKPAIKAGAFDSK